MGTGPLSGVARQARVFAAVFGNRELRWAGIAFLGFGIAEIATWVAILVFAFQQGGETTAGVVGVVQLVPAAIFAPFVASLGDCFARDRVLTAGYLAQALGYGATAASLLMGAPAPVTYGLGAVAVVLTTLSRPVHMALLPSLSRTAEELTAANVVTGTIESFSLFAGPALAGLLLGVSNAGAVFAAMAVALLGSTLCASRLSRQPKPVIQSEQERPMGLADELFGGMRALRAEPQARTVVGFLGAQQIVLGALDLLYITIAFRLLGTGSAGAGFLSASYGIGALVGGLAATLIVGRRLAPPLLAGAGFWGIALGAVGLAPSVSTAPALVGLGGVGRTLISVSGRTLLLRVVPDHLLARVFGALEGLVLIGLAAGMLVAPALVASLGPQMAVVAVGLFLPVIGVLIGRRLVSLDASASVPAEQLRLLRAIPIFAPLAPLTLERLARVMIPVSVPAGAVIIQQGDIGDRFYVLAGGEVDVTMDGRHVDAHGPGGYFGEVALLRNIPRTATVIARTPATLYALEREAFLEAVTGHPESAATADAVSRARYEDKKAEIAEAAEAPASATVGDG